MGQITVRTAGSFGPSSERNFSALEGGHANALGRAIAYISVELMPTAISRDHKLHDEGERPPQADFGKVKQTGE